MTNFKCSNCGSHWTEGATRDYREDQACRHCLSAAIDEAGGRVFALHARIAKLESERAEFLETISALDEENANLSHRLWLINNPE